ncbi:MAG: RecQ family ATP-dependent DNA helicase [Bacteroidaceae bacterium]|nr:RecQ family ATP-dependent DNA helicase [Bacteroidaceae bacterium]
MDYRAILKEYFGYEDFRGIQLDIIESIGAGRDTLGLMPTGGGKSITFQVPALAHEGLCLVISPLIALMKDQVRQLRRRGIKATAIYTGLTREEVIIALENCIFGNYKFLYVSPERLSSDLFKTKLRRMRVSMITVDEAHCISQWGYDFRPAYLHIAEIRKLLPDIPVLALTATATPDVVKDIQRQLSFRAENVKKMSFARANLIYNVSRSDVPREQQIMQLLHEHEGSAIVYTRNRAATRELSTWLTSYGISSTFYHAGLTNKEKNEHQEGWQNGSYRVIVATNAFGMGIDKADVRMVIHADVPDSPEAYFQEAGRAGRDGKPSIAVLLAGPRAESTLRRHIESAYPPIEYVAQVYEDMCCQLQMAVGDGFHVTREFDLQTFCINFHHYPTRAYNALQLLSRAGYIEWTDAEENQSRLMMVCERDALYRYSLPPAAERVLWHLLRRYTGIFADFVYISEAAIGSELGYDENFVSEQLISLSRMHILRFVPRRFIPYITFLCRRVEREEIVLPPHVYAERKRQLEMRIQTMAGYLNTHECRSRYLLNYFGEESAACGLCDNCGGDIHSSSDGGETGECGMDIGQQIVDFLQKNGPTLPHDIHLDGVSDRKVMSAVQELLEREIIECQKFSPTLTLKLPVRM